MTKPFKECLNEGQEFMDYVQERLYMKGVIAQFWTSAKYQLERGEGITGIEVKNDNKYKTTGNLFIEYEKEKNGQWIPTDLFRPGTWLFIIGDMDRCWSLPTVFLRRAQKQCESREVSYDCKVRGFLLSLELAERLDIKLI